MNIIRKILLSPPAARSGLTGLTGLRHFLTAYTPGVNFINVQRANFVHSDPENAKKKTSQLDCIFCALGICAQKSCL